MTSDLGQRRLRLGVMLPQTLPWKELSEQFRWAEDVGYDVAYVYDHLTHPTAAGRWLANGWSTLAAAAGVTERLELGTLVASATLHSPVALARLAATTDDIAGGRFVLGLGAGSPRCSKADRDEDPTPKEMFARLDDVVTGLQAVWYGETQWRGETRGFSGLETNSLPDGASPPFLMLATHGPKGLRLTARLADGWNTYGGPASVELGAEDYWRTLGEQRRRLEDACAEVGRDPASLRSSLLLGYGTVKPTADPAAYVVAARRAAELGFDELVVYGPAEDGVFASDAAVHEQAVGTLRQA